MTTSESKRNGFALVAVLITLVALTALATGGFLVSNGDLEISRNHTAGARAFNTADAAMYDHLGTNRRGTNTVNYSYASGAAVVAGNQLLDLGDGNVLYQIDAQSFHTMARGENSSRSVSVIVMTHDAGLKAKAALTAGSGVIKNGGAGTIEGYDEASSADCPVGTQPAVAGVETYPGGYTQTGGTTVPTGTPPVEDSQSGYDQLDDLGIDWGDLLSGSVVTPDFYIPTDAWPNFATLDPDWWPVIYIDAASYSVSPVHSGRGTLIAKGDLELNGGFSWDGIMLVGGKIDANGDATVSGMAVAGLNELLGQSVPPTTIANGTKEFLFNSCWVRYAAQQFVGGLIQVPGTWSEGM